jgi:replication factor A1
MVELTRDAIQLILAGQTDLQAVVQVTDIRPIGNQSGPQERFRLALTDGSQTQQAMLATQLNDFVKTGRVKKNSILMLQEYICNTVQNRKSVFPKATQTIYVNAFLS